MLSFYAQHMVNTPGMKPPHLVSANDQRSAAAARKHVARARKALTVLSKYTPRMQHRYTHRLHIEALAVRVNHPRASLAELAALKGQTKNAYWGALRRAFVYADRLKNAR